LELRDLGTEKVENFSRTTRKDILVEASRVQRFLNEYDIWWTETGLPSAQSLFESSKNLNERKQPDATSFLTSSTPEVAMKPGLSKEKPRRTQTEVGKAMKSLSPSYQPLCQMQIKVT
jgi:hypothetical protein